MNRWRAVNERFPYVSLQLSLGGQSAQFDAPLDTGFDGDVVVPAGYSLRGLQPVQYIEAFLADRSRISVPTYAGSARIGEIEIAPVLVLALGDMALIGTNLIGRFTVILDHGRRVIVEP